MLKAATLAEAQQIDRVIGAVDGVDESFQMDEESFRTFYDRTARSLWSYLYRSSSNAALADDVMQESYYRFLRARFTEMDQEYMKNYLFRIATNLLRDHWRHAKVEPQASSQREDDHTAQMSSVTAAGNTPVPSDVIRILQNLKPRERELLWLAYVEGSSHREIAQTVGLKEQSIRSLLFRARNKLAMLLRQHGVVSSSK
jgi:RNA polymerase sigma-70 factor, ECF subfamily